MKNETITNAKGVKFPEIKMNFQVNSDMYRALAWEINQLADAIDANNEAKIRDFKSRVQTTMSVIQFLS